VPKILLIRGGAIGDFILTLPVLAALRRQFPAARLEVLGYPHIAQVALAGGLADELRSIDARPLAGFFARDPALDPGLQKYFAEFPIIISYLYDPDRIFQNNVQRSCKGQFIAGPHRPEEVQGRHATEVFLEPLQRLAIFDADPVPRLSFATRSKPDGKLIALHPGSGSEQKNWPLQNWIELAQALTRKSNASLLLIGGEAEGNKLQTLAGKLTGDACEIALQWPLEKLAERLACCAVFVGHDSGITHLAAAIGIPTVALWGATAESVWRPRGESVRIVRSPGGLSRLPVVDVLQAIQQIGTG